jgi:uncharacterized protein
MKNMKTTSAIREPMVWLMLGIPLLTAIAGFYTLHIAGLAKATDVVNVPVSRIAQMQQSDLAADVNAARNNISARLNVTKEQWVISGVGQIGKQNLVLDLQHPIDKTQDKRIELQKQGNLFVSTAPISKNNDWLLQLSDEKKQWRLVGRLHRQADTAQLHAAVQLP